MQNSSSSWPLASSSGLTTVIAPQLPYKRQQAVAKHLPEPELLKTPVGAEFVNKTAEGAFLPL